MSDTEPSLVSDHVKRWFSALEFRGLDAKARFFIHDNCLYLNPESPDCIEYMDERKVATRSTPSDHGSPSLKVFRSYQD